MALIIDRGGPVAEAISGGPEVLESLASEWAQLCNEAGRDQNPFCRPEWIIAYTQAYDLKQILLVTARVNGRLRAVLPLVRERGNMWGVPARKLCRAAAADAPRFDLALTGDDSEAAVVVRTLWHCLRDDMSWDVIELAGVPKSAACWWLMTEAEKDGFPTGYRSSSRTPIISLTDLPDTGEDPWLARTSHNFRGQLRKKTRRLQKEGQLRLERFDHATPEVLERYYELERSTWKGEKGYDIVSDSRRLRFYNEIARALERLGYLSIFFLALDDRLIAGNICITSGGKLFALRCAFDPAFGSYSPGQILINWVLRDCVARQLSEFDFMGDDYEYKRHWTSQTLDHGYCYIFRRGLFGRALHALKFRVVPLGRTLFRRPLPG